MIGQQVQLYAEGVLDVRAGRRRERQPGESQKNRATYLLGYDNECDRMAESRRLVQETMPIECAPTRAPGTRPRGRPPKRRRHVPAAQGSLWDADAVGS